MINKSKWQKLVVNCGYDRCKVPIYHASAGNQKVPLLKTLLSSYCQNDCKFCKFNCNNEVKRRRWHEEELTRVPGIGPKRAEKLNKTKISSVAKLKKLVPKQSLKYLRSSNIATLDEFN